MNRAISGGSAVRKNREKEKSAWTVSSILARAIFIGVIVVSFSHTVPVLKKQKQKQSLSRSHVDGSPIITGHVDSGASQELDAQESQKEKKQKRSLWGHFYHFRKDYVYPVNQLVSLCSLGTLNGLEMARYKAGYDLLPGGIWCTKWWVGIVDAAAAQQPAEVIVRDDVIRRLGYILLYCGMKAGIQKVSNDAGRRFRAVVPARLWLNNIGVDTGAFNNMENTILFRFVGHLILDKAARMAGKIVVDPFAHAAYYTVKYKKKDWWGKKTPKKVA